MRVKINNSIYEMTTKQFEAVLKIAKDSVPHGIYAVRKRGIAIMLKEKYDSKGKLKEAIETYSKKGFKVYWK